MKLPTYRRSLVGVLAQRLRESRRFIQVVAGPRQVGKTTIARQMLASMAVPSHYASADDPGLRDRGWVRAQWEIGRRLAGDAPDAGSILVLDEIQKIPGWSDTVKQLWDEDSVAGVQMRLAVLGSSELLVTRGLAESLAGRFETVNVSHWSFTEMRDAFRWDVDRFIHFGGYPGAACLADDRHRWARYILDSLVETTLARDILLLTRVDKPALLRQLFRLSCDYSAQVVPYQRMLGQLQDAGNTTTLAHYLDLLCRAGLVMGLPKYSGARLRQRGSSPKVLVMNTALMTAHLGLDLAEARRAPEVWGRLVETAVGAHLVNTGGADGIDVSWWRDGHREVDFVLERGDRLLGIEVTSGRAKNRVPGLEAFTRDHGHARVLLVGGQGVPVADFLAEPAVRWLA